MPIEVTHEGQPAVSEDVVESVEAEALPVKKTPRLSLQKQREEILENLHLDLRVPRWTVVDEEGKRDIYVRYAPIRTSVVEQALRRRSGDERQTEASLLVHADVLINHCEGVFAVLDDDMDRKYTLALDENGETIPYPTQEWTKFDKSLAAALGLPEYQWHQATNIVRALYVTDGDLIDASNELSTWSAHKNETAAEDFTTP